MSSKKVSVKHILQYEFKDYEFTQEFVDKLVYEWIRRMTYYSDFKLSNSIIQSMAIQFKMVMQVQRFFPSTQWLSKFRSTYKLGNVNARALGIGYKESKSINIRDIIREMIHTHHVKLKPVPAMASHKTLETIVIDDDIKKEPVNDEPTAMDEFILPDDAHVNNLQPAAHQKTIPPKVANDNIRVIDIRIKDIEEVLPRTVCTKYGSATVKIVPHVRVTPVRQESSIENRLPQSRCETTPQGDTPRIMSVKSYHELKEASESIPLKNKKPGRPKKMAALKRIEELEKLIALKQKRTKVPNRQKVLRDQRKQMQQALRVNVRKLVRIAPKPAPELNARKCVRIAPKPAPELNNSETPKETVNHENSLPPARQDPVQMIPTAPLLLINNIQSTAPQQSEGACVANVSQQTISLPRVTTLSVRNVHVHGDSDQSIDSVVATALCRQNNLSLQRKNPQFNTNNNPYAVQILQGVPILPVDSNRRPVPQIPIDAASTSSAKINKLRAFLEKPFNLSSTVSKADTIAAQELIDQGSAATLSIDENNCATSISNQLIKLPPSISVSVRKVPNELPQRPNNPPPTSTFSINTNLQLGTNIPQQSVNQSSTAAATTGTQTPINPSLGSIYCIDEIPGAVPQQAVVPISTASLCINRNFQLRPTFQKQPSNPDATATSIKKSICSATVSPMGTFFIEKLPPSNPDPSLTLSISPNPLRSTVPQMLQQSIHPASRPRLSNLHTVTIPQKASTDSTRSLLRPQITSQELPKPSSATTLSSITPKSAAEDEISTKPSPKRPLKTREEALKCVKQMEEFAMMKENYRLIGFIERLEKHFKAED